jgi:nucleobase:cation symporter-1, NCS1 family
MSTLGQERRELTEAVTLDAHGIEPIPDADRDSTPLQQFWIWSGANLAPINWVLGALGIILGLSLLETILVVAIGNVVGCALFGLFCVMGHRTSVNQMVLSRSAFGRRGAYLPGVAQLLLAMGWIGVNTWIVLDLVLGVMEELGYTGGTGTKCAVAFFLMALQVLIAIYGFYLIRTFEKYTVPIAAVIMIVMSVLA